MNIISFDIEEWFIEKEFGGASKARYAEFDRILDRILLLLDDHHTKATFFCLGRIATDFPEVVRKIAERGHELGSHSNIHRWVNKMSPKEFREDTHAAIAALEDVGGQKVTSFRAPAFSIGESNKWAIAVLAENGIENDASIFPGQRDFGGFPNFTEQRPCVIEYEGSRINEFPIPLYRLPIIGKEIAYSGGGYFRLLPFSFVERQIAQSSYSMCYFHIADLLTDKSPLMSRTQYETYFKESGPLYKRLARYFKSNVGRNHAMENLARLLDAGAYCSIRDYLKQRPIEKTIAI